MKKYMIEKVRVGVSEGGFACGPVPGNVIVEAALRSEDGKLVYHCLADVLGTLNFYETEVSTFDRQVADDSSDDLTNLLSDSYTEGFGSYEEFYEDLAGRLPLSVTNLIHKYLACLACLSWEDTDKLKAASVGKNIGEFDIPLCDAEESYLAGRGEN